MSVEDKIEKIKDILELDCCESEESDHFGGGIKIIVLQRGWVIIGKYSQKGNIGKIDKGYVIRRWGTDAGIGQLAIEGKRSETVLDKIPSTKFHILTTIAMFDCSYDKWKGLCS